MDSIDITYYKSPYGELILGAIDDQLCLCDWRYRKMRTAIDNRIQKQLQTSYKEQWNPVHDTAIEQLEEYFRRERTAFSIPLKAVGTDFQKKIWSLLQAIPFGTVNSYLELALKFGDKNAVRAVANANGANALSIFIPCHRIIGSNGQLVGYAGGLRAKDKLLKLENQLHDLFD